MRQFYVYILKCSDGSYYVGHTDDIEHRIGAHRVGLGGVYTSKRLPVEVVFVQDFASRYEALVMERQIKRWTRQKKEALIADKWNDLMILAKKNFKI